MVLRCRRKFENISKHHTRLHARAHLPRPKPDRFTLCALFFFLGRSAGRVTVKIIMSPCVAEGCCPVIHLDPRRLMASPRRAGPLNCHSTLNESLNQSHSTCLRRQTESRRRENQTHPVPFFFLRAERMFLRIATRHYVSACVRHVTRTTATPTENQVSHGVQTGFPRRRSSAFLPYFV